MSSYLFPFPLLSPAIPSSPPCRSRTRLFELENELLEHLSAPSADILSDSALIESLERTKEVKDKLEESLIAIGETEDKIDEQREAYRSVAVHGATLFFALTQLGNIDPMYTYSLDSYLHYFDKALASAVVEPIASGQNTDELTIELTSEPRLTPTEQRVQALCSSLRTTVYQWISRGLHEQHKPALQLVITFSLLQQGEMESNGFAPELLQFLVRGPRSSITGSTKSNPSPLSWLTSELWTNITALSQFAEFSSLPEDIMEAETRFKEWCVCVCVCCFLPSFCSEFYISLCVSVSSHPSPLSLIYHRFGKESPEKERLPLTWARLEQQPFLKLLVLRCLRPDRIPVALATFVRTTLPEGDAFSECDATMNSYDILAECLDDAGPTTPIFFSLAPGSNVHVNLDVLAQYDGKIAGESYHVLSLGQGMDVAAKAVVEAAIANGHWVVLNNVQLVPSLLTWLDTLLEGAVLVGSEFEGASQEDKGFRIFLTADTMTGVPASILSRSIVLTNELPSGLRANLRAAFCTNKADISALPQRPRAILFGLCYFHAVMAERRKFGPAGFNVACDFSLQDLEDAKTAIMNYMELEEGEIPWVDLRYMVGEIIYGGHIVDERDRLLCKTLLEFVMQDDLFDEVELFPFVPTSGKYASMSFKAPLPTSYDRYLNYVATTLPERESPVAFGMHPNIEREVMARDSSALLALLGDLMPRPTEKTAMVGTSGGQDELTDTMHQVAGNVLNDIEERLVGVGVELADAESTVQNAAGAAGMDPFQTVLVQECAATDALITTVRDSVASLNRGFEGSVNMTASLEALAQSLFDDAVPATWAAAGGWTSQRPLSEWVADLLRRVEQLKAWLAAPESPPVVLWIGGLFSPQRYLTAVLQRTAQLQRVDLTELMLVTEVTRYTELDTDLEPPSRDSVLIKGFYLEGARFDAPSGMLADCRNGESRSSKLPVVSVRAMPREVITTAGVHVCPVYKVKSRAESWVFDVALKTKSPPQKWVIGGVALVLEK